MRRAQASSRPPEGARAAGRSEAQSLDVVEHGATLTSRWADPRRRAGRAGKHGPRLAWGARPRALHPLQC
jgi:hypothetical protein